MCISGNSWLELYLILRAKSRNGLELRKVRNHTPEKAGIIGVKAKICKWLLCLKLFLKKMDTAFVLHEFSERMTIVFVIERDRKSVV